MKKWDRYYLKTVRGNVSVLCVRDYKHFCYVDDPGTKNEWIWK